MAHLPKRGGDVMVLTSHCPPLPMFTLMKYYDYLLEKLALAAHDCEYGLHKMDCLIHQSDSLYLTWVVTSQIRLAKQTSGIIRVG